MQRFIQKKSWQNIVISNDGKRIVQLKDIADVEVKEAVEYIKINANGKEGLLIAVIKQPNANLVDLSTAMEAKSKRFEKYSSQMM